MPKERLYKKYAKFYDKIYAKKSYVEEVEFVRSVMRKFKAKGKNILDMACGTGTHAKLFSDSGFRLVGVDINREMLKIARKKAKNAIFLESQMQSFRSKDKFDVITCLFSAINYNRNLSELKNTIMKFYELLKKGGIVVFDLGFIKGKKGRIGGAKLDTYSEKGLQIARIGQANPSKDDPDVCKIDFLIFIKNKGTIDFEIDEHELGMFSVREVKNTMAKAGFSVKIYGGFTLKKFTNKSKVPIFVGIKK
ncbi:class I SAM-dependent methyltransferase [Candidatus Woesearchaeota archaeon]|nr:class I SAM-dependent methyltransferase [Candidatus Woesearchaeota archaeon]